MSFDLPAATLAGAIEELGTAAEVAANKGEAPVNIFNSLGEQGELAAAGNSTLQVGRVGWDVRQGSVVQHVTL